MELHGLPCALHRVLQLELRTVHVRVMLPGVRPFCIVVYFVGCVTPVVAASGMVHAPLGCYALHGARCAVHVCALRTARWMLRNACCIYAVAVFVTATQLLG